RPGPLVRAGRLANLPVHGVLQIERLIVRVRPRGRHPSDENVRLRLVRHENLSPTRFRRRIYRGSLRTEFFVRLSLPECQTGPAGCLLLLDQSRECNYYRGSGDYSIEILFHITPVKPLDSLRGTESLPPVWIACRFI